MIDSYPIIFSDLDGTLLGHDTYSWGEAAQALEICRKNGVPVVLVSSKTRAEIVDLQRDLNITAPFASENGGGVFFPKSAFQEKIHGSEDGGEFWKVTLGASYEVVCSALRDVSLELEIRTRGFSQMSLQEIVDLTGLSGKNAEKAGERDFDEPFIIEGVRSVDEDELRACVHSRGLELSVGGRFFHIHGVNDKASALDKVVSCYKLLHSSTATIALGDSQNDFSMLKSADRGVYVGKGPLPVRGIPTIRKSLVHGPAGWNIEVMRFLRETGVRGIP